MNHIIRIFSVISLISFHYSCTNDDDSAKFRQLNGNDFILEVKWISEYPDVQLPSDQIDENDYKEIGYKSEYEVSFSEELHTISIMGDSISGLIMDDKELNKTYDLHTGLFAGGRFSVWISNGGFEAEYTVYGSGVPIIRSERGNLISL
jgi:hypothetical protein